MILIFTVDTQNCFPFNNDGNLTMRVTKYFLLQTRSEFLLSIFKVNQYGDVQNIHVIVVTNHLECHKRIKIVGNSVCE